MNEARAHHPVDQNKYARSVSWAGVTVVERTLALMQEALEVDPEWEYFVNIGQVGAVCCFVAVCVCVDVHGWRGWMD